LAVMRIMDNSSPIIVFILRMNLHLSLSSLSGFGQHLRWG
jgi:hypothetical protein